MPRSQSAYMSVILLLLIVACAELSVAADDNSSSVNPELLHSIIQHMEQALLQNRAHARPYSVTRDYVLYGNDADHVKGHIVAQVNFLPPNRKSYDIAESTGGFQEKVVRRVLDHEVEVTRDPQDTWLTSRNYDFELVGEQSLNGRRCYVLKTHPKRSDKDLMKANVWVDGDSYRILRIDGEPQKSPSFWVKDVHITLEFGDVSGMWLQTHTQAVARVRFAGDYKMYSRDMRYDTAPVLASAPAPAPVPAQRSATAVAAASTPSSAIATYSIPPNSATEPSAPATAVAASATTPASLTTPVRTSVVASAGPAPAPRVHRSRTVRRTAPLLADGVWK
ncbi:MAG TPA: outer membrane lipoprotein-sorting protein [Terriglobales bacterium]